MNTSHVFKRFLSVLFAGMLACALASCVKQTSDDAEILNDAGTSSGAAIILDPDEEKQN